MSQRFNPPPSWPRPPEGWEPPVGWTPDPAWGPPPPGWQLWQADAPWSRSTLPDPGGRRRWRRTGLVAAGVVAALLTAGALQPADPPASPRPAPSERPVPSDPGRILLTPRGLSDLEVGASTSISDVENYLGRRGGLYLAGQTDECGLAIAEDLGMAFVTDENQGITALINQDPQLRTAEGVGVGSTLQSVQLAYPELVTVLDSASQTGGPIVVVDDLTQPGAPLTADSRLMAFDTDAGRVVTRMRVGMWPWVGYTDYCSDDAGDNYKTTGWPLTRTPS